MSNPKLKNKKRRRIILAAVLVLAAVGGGLYWRHSKREKPIEVQTEKVARRDITELVVANGRVQPVIQVVIQPEVSGEIIELPVKEGQLVKKGDLLVKIKPDNYVAQRNSANASYLSAIAGQSLAKANQDKAQLEYERYDQLHKNNLVSDSQFLEAKTALEVMRASFDTALHQVEQAKATLARAEDDLSKTTIVSPLDGTVTKVRSEKGERVVGAAMMAGTEILTVADLDEIEARVDIGEIDVVLIKLGQKARLEVDAFHDRKFNGVVKEIANAAKGAASSTQQSGNGQQQEATKFEVKILITEKEQFRPGMSVTAEIETRSKSNVLSAPIMAVTTRLPKGVAPKKEEKPPEQGMAQLKVPKKDESQKPKEVVFVVNGDAAKVTPVKTGISDDTYMEITDGLKEGQEIVSGGYAAVSRLLEDGKKIKKGGPEVRKKSGNKES